MTNSFHENNDYSKSSMLGLGFNFLFEKFPVNTRLKYKALYAIFRRYPGYFKELPSFRRWKANGFPPCPKSKYLYLLKDISPSDIHLSICDNPVVSIIIPSFGNCHFTRICLKSIADNEPECSYEVIVIDDASSDPNLSTLKSIPNIRFLENKQNMGFSKTCNIGAREAKGEYFNFLNNDIEVTSGWLDTMISLTNKDNIGLVGSKLLFPDGKLQEAGGIIWNNGSGWNYGKFDDPTASCYNYVRLADYCSGASLLIKKNIFRKVNGFDEWFSPAYYEDTDLAFRLRAIGMQTAYQPASQVFHFEGASHGTDTSKGKKLYQQVNKDKFIARWKHLLRSNHFEPGYNVFQARENSKSKKILVIDHYIPETDMDTGSRNIFQYITILIELGFRVDFWPKNMTNNALYSRQLQQLGVHVFYGLDRYGNFQEWAKNHGEIYHQVLISRPLVSDEYLEPLKLLFDQKKLVYYGHDIHHLRLYEQYQIDNNPKTKEKALFYEELEKKLWKVFNTILYPSQSEVDYVNRFTCCTNCYRVPVNFFVSTKSNFKIDYDQRKGLLFVAGFKHPPNIDGAVWFCGKVLPLVRRKHPAIPMYIVGSHPTEEVLALKDNDNTIQVTGYVTEKKLNSYYESAKVAVIPLRFGAGVKGKVLEAMHAGVPVVTTEVGTQGMAELKDEVVLTANDADAMAQKINSLLENRTLWNRCSAKGKKFINNHYSKESMKESLGKIFN